MRHTKPKAYKVGLVFNFLSVYMSMWYILTVGRYVLSRYAIFECREEVYLRLFSSQLSLRMNLFSDRIKIQIIIKYSILKIAFIRHLFDMCYVPGPPQDIDIVMKDLIPNLKELIV